MELKKNTPKTNSLIQRTDWSGLGVGKMGKGSQNKFWACNVQHGDYG